MYKTNYLLIYSFIVKKYTIYITKNIYYTLHTQEHQNGSLKIQGKLPTIFILPGYSVCFSTSFYAPTPTQF